VQGAHGVIFVRERRTEQSHDAIAGELVDGAFIPMHLLRQDLEAPVHEGMHVLRIERPGQRAEPHDVRKQHCDLLALAFQGAAHGQDLVGQVPRRVGL
jgi:hypothetical protein